MTKNGAVRAICEWDGRSSASAEADAYAVLEIIEPYILARCEEVRREAERYCAAQVLRQADRTSESYWVPLSDVAHDIMRGEARENHKTGDFDDDLLRRVDGFATPKKEPTT